MKANTRKRISVIVAIVAVLAIFIVAVRVSPIGAMIRRANEWSAIMSLHQQIEAELQTYHAQYGRYPDSLRTLAIDYSKTDQARPAQLDEFLYRVTDTGYELNSKRDAQKKPATGPILNSNESPNHALQRTGSAVTAPAADHRRLSAHRQVPRPLRLSLSLGSLGPCTRFLS
jgi:type II secretory pathway pseudopilin PulG